MSDDEITEFLDSGKWRVRIVKWVRSRLSTWAVTKISHCSTWRPINKVDAFPLALCDHRTVDKDDLVETDVVNEDYVGETYSVKYNPKHLFYWLKDQRPDELCVFVTFDSQNSPAGSAITSMLLIY
jgi:hypothetical protein